MLAFILVQYVARPFTATVHLSRAEGLSTQMHVLTYLSMSFVICHCCNAYCRSPVFFQQSFAPSSLEVITSHSCRILSNGPQALLQLFLSPITKALYLFLLITNFQCLVHNMDPHFLSRYWQAVVSSSTSNVWGIAGQFCLRHKHHTGFSRCCETSYPALQGPLTTRRKQVNCQLGGATTYCMVQFPGMCADTGCSRYECSRHL